MTRRRAGSSTVAVAFRGRLEMSAISPKNSPGPSVARVFTVSRTVLVMTTLPAWRTNISFPVSPSWKSTVPLGNSFPNRWKSVSSAVGMSAGVDQGEVNQLPPDRATSRALCATCLEEFALHRRGSRLRQVATRDAVVWPDAEHGLEPGLGLLHAACGERVHRRLELRDRRSLFLRGWLQREELPHPNRL